MQIQSGKLYENRTWKYLYPSLKSYGEELMNHLASFFKLAVGIGDYHLEGESYKDCIFILIETNMQLSTDKERIEYKKNFSKFIAWVSYQYYYITDYVYEGIGASEKHMLVLKMPVAHEVSYLHFIRGQYHKMYSKKEINRYFQYVTLPNKEFEKVKNDKIKNTRDILSRDSGYLEVFLDKVFKDFNAIPRKRDFLLADLDYPPILKEEIFNYKEGI